MKIIVFKWKPLLFSGAAAAILVSLFCFAATPKLISAFSSSNGRSLPIYSVQTEEKKIALGFNCAWDDADIPSLLSTLDACDVKATFFLLGEWACKYPDTAKLIALSGHEIGSHSNTHRDMDTLSSEEIRSEINDSRNNIYTACGQTPVLFRPPSGSYNDLVIDTIHQCGCIPIQWSIDTLDWQGLNAQQMVARVQQQLAPGAILLLHAGAQHTAQALPQLLQTIQDAGYTPVPVGELIYPDSSLVDHTGKQFPLENNK